MDPYIFPDPDPESQWIWILRTKGNNISPNDSTNCFTPFKKPCLQHQVLILDEIRYYKYFLETLQDVIHLLQ